MKQKIIFDNESGFKIIELVVIIFVVILLSSILIPSYKNYLAKGRTQEAKLDLIYLYNKQQEFFAKYNTYAHCFNEMNVVLQNSINDRYYIVGFGKGDKNSSIHAKSNGASQCFENTFTVDKLRQVPPKEHSIIAYGQNKTINSKIKRLFANELSEECTIKNHGHTFVICARGIISDKGIVDEWRIDQDKNLTHHIVGY